MTIKRNRHKC